MAIRGSCLCGGISFEIDRAVGPAEFWRVTTRACPSIRRAQSARSGGHKSSESRTKAGDSRHAVEF